MKRRKDEVPQPFYVVMNQNGQVYVGLKGDKPVKVRYTPQGRKIVLCPAQSMLNMTCSQCQLCQLKDRSYIIGFEAHGNGKGKI